jgi:hypothetical protein
VDTPKLDKFSKIVWLVNGVILLGLGLFGLGFAAVSTISESREHRRTAITAGASADEKGADAHVRAVRFDTPEAVRGTNVRFVIVRHGSGYLTQPPMELRTSGGSYARARFNRESGPMVNFIFLPPAGAAGHLLFDRPAYIDEFQYPGGGYFGSDTAQNWFTYRVALEDTDGNGRLDGDDAMELYVSDLDGQHLTRVLPPGWRIHEFKNDPDHKSMTVTALRVDTASHKAGELSGAEERAFTYEVAARTLKPYVELNALAAQAAAVLGRSSKH